MKPLFKPVSTLIILECLFTKPDIMDMFKESDELLQKKELGDDINDYDIEPIIFNISNIVTIESFSLNGFPPKNLSRIFVDNSISGEFYVCVKSFKEVMKVMAFTTSAMYSIN
jgi:hypothetical protein